MDTITHGIVGALVGKALFAGPEVPAALVPGGVRNALSSPTARVAIVSCTLGAIFPDIDIFAGPLAQRELVAAPWVPDASLDRGDGKVRPEFMSAALDCPGYFSVCSDDRMMVLGQLTVHVDRLVHVGESCIVVGWKIGVSGRKYEAGTAIFDGDGELCGRARAVWIEPRSLPPDASSA